MSGDQFERAIAPKIRRRRAAGTRFDDIVAAAAKLFSEQGYAGTSIQEIANSVGLLKGSLYHYIHTKEELLEAVIQEAHNETASLGFEALHLDGDALQKLKYVISRHLAGATENLAKVRVFYREASYLPPGRLQEILATRDTYEHCVRQIIVLGQKEGTLDRHLEPTLTAIAILAVLNNVQQWFRPDGPRTLQDVTDAFTDLILRSVATNPSAVESRLTAKSRRRRSRGETAASGGIGA